jgi:hypothetical protein
MLIRAATTTADDPAAAVAGLAAALDARASGPPDFLALHFAATLPAGAMRAAALAALAPKALHGGTSCLGAMSGEGARVDGRAAGAFAIWDPAGDYGTGAADLGGDPRAAARAAALAALAAAGRPGEAPDLVWLTAAPGAEEAVLAGVCDVMGEDAAILGGSSADNAVTGDWAQIDAAAARSRGVVVSALFPSRPVACAVRNVHAPAAGAVYPRSGPGADDGRDHHRHREGAEHPDRRQAETLRHGRGENGRDVMARRPADRKRGAERRDDHAPPFGRQPRDHRADALRSGRRRGASVPVTPSSRAGTAGPTRRRP